MTQILGVGMLGGVGFTVALLITDLGFRQTPLFIDEAKLGVLVASGIASVLGLTFLFIVGHPPEHESAGTGEAESPSSTAQESIHPVP